MPVLIKIIMSYNYLIFGKQILPLQGEQTKTTKIRLALYIWRELLIHAITN